MELGVAYKKEFSSCTVHKRTPLIIIQYNFVRFFLYRLRQGRGAREGVLSFIAGRSR